VLSPLGSELTGLSRRVCFRLSLSAVPPELLGIEAQIKALSLQSRDRIKASLSDSRFAQLESKLHKRDSFIQDVPEDMRSKSPESMGSIYAYSSIDFDPTTKQVTAYAETEIDGTLLPYYEPTLNVVISDADHSYESASSWPQQRASTFVCRFAGNARAYGIHADHGVNLMIQDAITKQWIDPAGYEDVRAST
jgi:hypothetical protein